MVTSDKLLFPDGTDRDVTLERGKNQTVRVAVETRSSGTFPLLMTVTSAGGLPITSEVTVRSSFVSGVGVFLAVGGPVSRGAVGLGHPTTSPTPSDGVNDDPAGTSQFDDPQLDVPQFDSPQFDAPGLDARRFTPSDPESSDQSRVMALERGRRASAPRRHGSPASCASWRSPTVGVTALAGTYSYANETPT